MTEKLPIPAYLWQRILEFLKDDKSGSIVLRVHRGAVRGAEITEQVKAEANTRT